ncbi:MAG: hypothetical protein AB1714_05740 [Acidobacteriota bacterium]
MRRAVCVLALALALGTPPCFAQDVTVLGFWSISTSTAWGNPLLTASDQLIAAMYYPSAESFGVDVRMFNLRDGNSQEFIPGFSSYHCSEADMLKLYRGLSSYVDQTGERYLLDRSESAPRVVCADSNGRYRWDRTLPPMRVSHLFRVDPDGVVHVVGNMDLPQRNLLRVHPLDPRTYGVFQADGTLQSTGIPQLVDGRELVTGSMGLLPNDSLLVPMAVGTGGLGGEMTGDLRIYQGGALIASIIDQVRKRVSERVPKGQTINILGPLACCANHAAIYVETRDPTTGKRTPFHALVSVNYK